MMIKCENCGASFDSDEAKCPYCGALNLIGAEKQYMKHLDQMNRDFAEMADDSKEEYQKSFKFYSKRIGIIFAVIVVVILLLVGLFFIMKGRVDRYDEEYAQLKKSELLWKNEYRPTLEKLCEEKKTEEIEAYCKDTIKLPDKQMKNLREYAFTDDNYYDFDLLDDFFKKHFMIYEEK